MPEKKQTPKQEGIADRAREIWLAGLGVFSTMEEEGTKMFHSFVEKGKDLEKKGEKVEKRAKEGMDSVASYLSGKKGELPNFAKLIEEKMNTAFEKFGVASHSEVREIGKKVDKLSEQVEQLTKKLNQ
jgi:poly(hydroxyalkanoate) granule-associated protein